MYFVYWLVVTNLYSHQKANCLAAYQLNKFSTLDPGVFVLLIIMFSCKSVKFGYLYQNCNVFTQFKESRVSFMIACLEKHAFMIETIIIGLDIKRMSMML